MSINRASSIAPIQTRYKGYHFRSRLEARWAVFFDALNIEWEYEKEGYDLGELGWYLPDFYLPQMSIRGETEEPIFIEIKGVAPGPLEEYKCDALTKQTHISSFIFCGLPDVDYNSNGLQFVYSPEWVNNKVWWDNDMHFYQCDKCKNIKIEFMESNYMVCGCGGHYECDTPLLLNAYISARSARFEYGECGIT